MKHKIEKGHIMEQVEILNRSGYRGLGASCGYTLLHRGVNRKHCYDITLENILMNGLVKN